MILVTLTRDRLSVTGHAGAAAKGQDVVCAAVSALAQALVLGLNDVIGIPVRKNSLQPGSLEAAWDPDLLGPSGEILIKTIQESLKLIEQQNGSMVSIR